MLTHNSIDEYIHIIEQVSVRGKTKDTFLDTNMFTPLVYDGDIREIALDNKVLINNILHKYPEEYPIIRKQVESLLQKMDKLMGRSSVGISPTVAEELFGPKKLKSYRDHAKDWNRNKRLRITKGNTGKECYINKDNELRQRTENIINASIIAKRQIVNNNRESLEAFTQTGGWKYYRIAQGLHESYLSLSKNIGKIPKNDDKIFFEIFKYATTNGRIINFFTRDTDFITLVHKTFDPIQEIFSPTDFEINMYLYNKQECVHSTKFEYNQRTRILEMKNLVKIDPSEKIYAHRESPIIKLEEVCTPRDE